MRLDLVPRSLSEFFAFVLVVVFGIITVFAGAPSTGMYVTAGVVVYFSYLSLVRVHDRLKYGKQRGER